MDADLRTATDEELVAWIAVEAEEGACEELFRRFHKKIYLWCFNYTRDTEEAVDWTQEIFIRIFRNLGSFAGRARFSTWVFRVTRNHCLGKLTQKRETWRKAERPLEDGDVEDGGGQDALHEADLRGDLDRILVAARKRMKAEELEAFVLHYREGLTVQEITKLLGCQNLTGARTLIQNARRKFRQIVAAREYPGD